MMCAKYKQCIEKIVAWGCSSYVTQKEKDFINGIRDVETWQKTMFEEMSAIYGDDLQSLWSQFVDCYTSYDDIFVSDLDKIACPVLILHGIKDPIIAPEHPEFLNERIANTQLAYLPGSHACHKSCHEKFNEFVNKFLIE